MNENVTTPLNEACPCCSGIKFEDCCSLYLNGASLPSTPEQLMRSRYTAFTKADTKYIFATMAAKALKQSDAEATREWAQRCTWLGLEVIEAFQDSDDVGVVEFIAKYSEDGAERALRERSLFQKRSGRWYYVGEAPKASNAVNSKQAVSAKINRNDPCPCGSGKKYKKCCFLQQEVQ